MLIVFVLDTSASMNQKIASGLSLLDCAKSAVEHFHKVRQRDASSRMDRYMLVTCGDGLSSIKILDKYPFTQFMRTLKSIQARDLTSMGGALQRAFDFLHLQRLAAGIDNYGQGRNPCSIDPTMVMLLTDGTELTSLAGVSNTLMLPGGPLPVGAELSMQPFRWDQRVFATILRIPSVNGGLLEKSAQNTPISGAHSAVAMDTNVSAFCEVTGGKCVVMTSWKVLMQHMEVMASRLQPCVIVSFEHIPLPGTNSTMPQQVHAACQRKMMFIRGGQVQGQGHWPVPEAYWPDPNQLGLPPREAHPTFAYKAVDSDPYIPQNFIFDKYEIESNPIMGFLLKAQAGVCWQVFIANSKGTNNGFGDPFGYLRLNRTGNTLSLFVLPYNYPALFSLLDQLSKMPPAAKIAPPQAWRQDLERFCASIPPYYAPPLRAALKRWGLMAHVVPDSMDKAVHASFVGSQLKRMKGQAKSEVDKELTRLQAEHSNLVNSQNQTRSQARLFRTPQADQPAPAAPPLPKDLLAQAKALAGSTTSLTQQPIRTPPSTKPPQKLSKLAETSSESTEPSLGQSPTGSLPRGAYLASLPKGAALGGPAESAAIGLAKNVQASSEAAVFRNAFDVPRDQILQQLLLLPVKLAMHAESARKAGRPGLGALAAKLAAAQEEEARHSVPIEKMGDFNEALMRQQPPRNPFVDDDRGRRALFGNPYRQERAEGADEAWDQPVQGPGGAQIRGGRKKRRPSEVPSPGPPANNGTEVTSKADPGSNTAAITPGKERPSEGAVPMEVDEVAPVERKVGDVGVKVEGSRKRPGGGIPELGSPRAVSLGRGDRTRLIVKGPATKQ